MRSRLVIAGLGGLVVGLTALVLYQARLMKEARQELGALALPLPEHTTNTSPRPIRLRLQDLPPIAIRTQVQQLDWRSIESDDYGTYVANLRQIGCPEETIRDILLADINKLYATRRRALTPAPTNTAFWLHPDEDPVREVVSEQLRQNEEALAALERERRQLVATLLGESVSRAEFADLVEESMRNDGLQFLDPSRRRPLAEAQARYRQAMDSLDGIADPEQRKELERAAEKAYQEAVAANLSPEEKNQLELRTSALSEELRDQLRGFGASRAEFENLYKLQSGFAHERETLEQAGANGTDPRWREKIEAAETQLEDAIRQSLGPARYADLQRTRDPDYQTLFGLAREHEMPVAVAHEVWDMKQTVAQHTETIRANPLLTATQKRAALEAVRKETQSAIAEVLGEPLLDEYQRQSGGWLTQMTDPQLVADTTTAPVQDSIATPPPLPPVPTLYRLQPTPILPVP